MTPYSATLVNAVVLIALSAWAYLDAGSPTALIPAGFGGVFLLLSPMLNKSKKMLPLFMVLAFVIVIALVRPLMGAIADGRTLSMARVSLMMATSLLALFIYTKALRSR